MEHWNTFDEVIRFNYHTASAGGMQSYESDNKNANTDLFANHVMNLTIIIGFQCPSLALDFLVIKFKVTRFLWSN